MGRGDRLCTYTTRKLPIRLRDRMRLDAASWGMPMHAVLTLALARGIGVLEAEQRSRRRRAA